MRDLPELLRCPRCRGPVQKGEAGLRCAACAAGFATHSHLVDLRAPSRVSEQPLPALSDLERTDNERDWPALVRAYVERAEDRLAALYECASAGRAAFRVLLDLHPQATVLEIGGETGLIASGIARLASVVLVESRVEPALLARQRFEIHNRSDDVVVLLVDPGARLPLQDARFDCVVLSGGRGDLEGQLGEVRRVLKPGGQLFWIAENRFSYVRRWRFTRVTGARSFFDYRSRLRAAGFERSVFFALVESQSHLVAIRPLARGSTFWKPRKLRGFKSRLKGCTFLVPRYGILSERGLGPSTSFLRRVLDEIGHALGSELIVRDFRVSRKDKAVLQVQAGDSELIVRIALSPAGLASDERNARMLLLLSRHEGVHRLVPRSLLQGVLSEQAYFVETRAIGKPLARAMRGSEFSNVARQVQSFMEALNPVVAPSAQEELSGVRFEREVWKPIEEIGPLLEDSGSIPALRDYFEKELYGIRLPVGITHGDLSLSNLFVDGDERLTGVIDWEGSSESSLPVLDAIHYVESHHRVLTGDRLGRAITRLARGDFADEAHRRFLFETYERMRIAPSAHTALVRLKWVRHIAYLASFWLAYSAEGIRDFVSPVVSSILESSSPPD